MSRWNVIRYSLVGLVLLLNVSLALCLFCLKKDNDQIRSAYLERAYFIYSNEIYPVIDEMDLQELQNLYASTLAGIFDFRVNLGLNSLVSADQELYRVCMNGDTGLYESLRSMVGKMYLIVDPDSFSGPIYDSYKGIPAEELLNSVKRENQEMKDALDAELEAGNRYIAAFEAIEPHLPDW